MKARLEGIVALLLIVVLFACLRGALGVANTRKLGHALRAGDVNAAQMLIARGANVNGRDEDGDLMLMAAVRYLNKPLVKLLEDNGAQGDVKTKLMAAAFMNRPQEVEALLKNGLDPNLKDRDGDTALSCAAVQGNVEVIRILLKHGTNPNHINQSGLRPIDWTTHCPDLEKRRAMTRLLQPGYKK